MTDPVDTDALRADSAALTKRAAYAMFEGDLEQQEQLQYAANRALLAADEVDRLRAVIENAPHDNDCHWGTVMNYDDLYPCTCWKAGAL